MLVKNFVSSFFRIYFYYVISHRERAGGDSRRKDAKTQSVRCKLFYEMDFKDTAIVKHSTMYSNIHWQNIGLLRNQLSNKIFMFLQYLHAFV